jgi:hypothetical protein
VIISEQFHEERIVIGLNSVLIVIIIIIIIIIITVLVLLVFHMCALYCPLLFMFVRCAVTVIGHLAADSAG